MNKYMIKNQLLIILYYRQKYILENLNLKYHFPIYKINFILFHFYFCFNLEIMVPSIVINCH